MLPRNSGTRSRVGSARPALDTRKIILVVLALVLVAYFAVVNSFFSLSQQQQQRASVIANGGGALTGDANAEPSAQEKEALADALAAEKAQEERDAAARARTAATTQPPVHKPEHKWVRNPERRYVWLDVAIDDVYIGRVTAEVRPRPKDHRPLGASTDDGLTF